MPCRALGTGATRATAGFWPDSGQCLLPTTPKKKGCMKWHVKSGYSFEAPTHSRCRLCGEMIEDPMTAILYETGPGTVLRFCCPGCLSIYMAEAERGAGAEAG